MHIFVLTATYELRVSRKVTYVTTLLCWPGKKSAKMVAHNQKQLVNSSCNSEEITSRKCRNT
jgi:hypothetical protein